MSSIVLLGMTTDRGLCACQLDRKKLLLSVLSVQFFPCLFLKKWSCNNANSFLFNARCRPCALSISVKIEQHLVFSEVWLLCPTRLQKVCYGLYSKVVYYTVTIS